MKQEPRTKQAEPLRRLSPEPPGIRAEGKSFIISGYAALFGSVYQMGWYTEEVAPTAFKNADLSDVRILFNHDASRLHGRTKSKTARVVVDSRGLWYQCTLPKTAEAETLAALIERGDIDASSWGFQLRYTDASNGDRWEKRNGKDHRILTDVALVFDCSPVVFPANPSTTVTIASSEAKRSFDAYHATHAATTTHTANPADDDDEHFRRQAIIMADDMLMTRADLVRQDMRRLLNSSDEADHRRRLNIMSNI